MLNVVVTQSMCECRTELYSRVSVVCVCVSLCVSLCVCVCVLRRVYGRESVVVEDRTRESASAHRPVEGLTYVTYNITCSFNGCA